MATIMQTQNYHEDFLNHGKKLQNLQILRKGLTINRKTIPNLDKKTGIQNPSDRKMYLVLDLDHTLLNSTPIDDLSKEEDYLLSKVDSSKRGLFRLDRIGVMTKLRPFVRTFLCDVSKMFELYVYTMGDRKYALEMVKLLDPENNYFNSRIISRDDCLVKDKKGLDVLQKPENSVLVLDDSEKVWPNHKDNLIVMDRYMYFSSSCRQFGFNKCKSLSELKRDEDELDGALSTVLQVLKRIHREYFDSSNHVVDVREMLKNVRNNILKGCKIVFSGIIPKNLKANEHRLWKICEELGANCCVDVENDVTHVVSLDLGTKKSKWAIGKCKFLVHPRWIEASYILWRRQLEDKFEMTNKPNNKTNNHQSMLEKEKLNDTNFLDWYRNLKKLLKMEKMEYVLEKPLPDEPKKTASLTARVAFERHNDHSLQELFKEQTSNVILESSMVEKERLASPRLLEDDSIIKLDGITKIANQNMKPRLGKKVKDTKRNNKSSVKRKVVVEDRCFYCNELAHWKRNCPKYLNDVKNNTAATSSLSGTKRKHEVIER